MGKMDLPRLWWLLFSLLFLQLACRNDKNSLDKTLTEAAEGSQQIPDRDNRTVDSAYITDVSALNPRNPRWYTYQYNDESEITSENTVLRSNKSGIVLDSMYEISETARPPLFNKNCLTAAQPEQCSNEAVLDWMQYAVERPAIAAGQQNQVIHYVRFTIDEKGKVALDEIIPTSQPCERCVIATREAIGGMPNWIPAIRGKQPVKVQITLPVYYD